MLCEYKPEKQNNKRINTAPKPRICHYDSGQKNIKTLQAQTNPGIRTKKAVRKVFFCCRKRASMTVEAAVCLPFLLFTALMLLAPLKMMDARRQLQNRMEAVAKDMAMAAYAEKQISVGRGTLLKSDSSVKGEILTGLTEGINTAAAAAGVLGFLDGNMYRNAVFSKCEVIKNDMISMELCYDMKLPFELFGIKSIPMSSVVNRRAWTGAAGGRGSDKYGVPEDGSGGADGYDRDEEGDEIVYVGKTSTVYHKDRHCHYLDNVLKKVSAEEAKNARNQSGGRYHACESCRPQGDGDVYLLGNGTAYHSSEHCKAIISYAEEVKLKDVEALGPCSYCSGGGHGAHA